MSNRGYIRTQERNLYLSERELEKTKKTLSNIETKFGKSHIAFRVYSRKIEELELIVKTQKSNLDFWKKAK